MKILNDILKENIISYPVELKEFRVKAEQKRLFDEKNELNLMIPVVERRSVFYHEYNGDLREEDIKKFINKTLNN